MRHTAGHKLHQTCSHVLEILSILWVRAGAWVERVAGGMCQRKYAAEVCFVYNTAKRARGSNYVVLTLNEVINDVNTAYLRIICHKHYDLVPF